MRLKRVSVCPTWAWLMDTSVGEMWLRWWMGALGNHPAAAVITRSSHTGHVIRSAATPGIPYHQHYRIRPAVTRFLIWCLYIIIIQFSSNHARGQDSNWAFITLGSRASETAFWWQCVYWIINLCLLREYIQLYLACCMQQYCLCYIISGYGKYRKSLRLLIVGIHPSWTAQVKPPIKLC